MAIPLVYILYIQTCFTRKADILSISLRKTRVESIGSVENELGLWEFACFSYLQLILELMGGGFIIVTGFQ